ncbi:OmpA family protein [Riemerella anatipestifer]|uniref:OmpA family protein n=1 Tax=Riemerella anatipestifer TaxID=34085 RepID=UPI00286589DB|nr:OmpA family protein [Riemerella anatipestifer]MDR7694199.1 OmpA family protein [Riemerella anatipestifer]MDR7794229.1 OmpA family protein [Riemerella anatipestifer]
MKLNLASIALVLSFPAVLDAQVAVDTIGNKYPNTFSSWSSNVVPFTRNVKRFNDWSVSAGIGIPFIQSADVTSIKNGNGKNLYGYSMYLSVDRALTHAFGLNLQYDRGETRQGAYRTGTGGKGYAARTQYDAISLLGDINFSNLFRRIDNHSNYRWAIHGYAGVGTLAYRAYAEVNGGEQTLKTEIKPFKITSLFGQAGAGVKFKVSRRVDLESRLMYVVTGDDEFDGGGAQYSERNRREDQVSDNFFNATLGVSYKIGKHISHVMWHDPYQELYDKIELASVPPVVEVCKSGDADNDGVCDDWDRQLDTPAGARVDGAGVALDTDLDGVIDLHDKCVTVPGPVSNNGCPEEKQIVQQKLEQEDEQIVAINKNFEGIEFDFNSDVIRTISFDKLDNAVAIMKTLRTDRQYLVIGATDTRGSDAYNQKLSQRRAESVVRYLVGKGVPSYMLTAEGRGKKDLKYPECNPYTKCPEWKNEANRRVYFKAK